MVVIKEKDFNSFFEAPFHAYGQKTDYVSPMRSDLKRILSASENPLFVSDNDFSYFTAIQDGQPIGRIVVHQHTASNALHKTNQANFGFFDCKDDSEVASKLLDEAMTWARSKGFNEVVGNFNLTAMQTCGVQTSGYGTQPFTDMITNPPHIPKLLEENGFERFFPMTTFELNIPSAKLTKKKLAKDSHYSFSAVNKKTYARHMVDACKVLNDGFSKNPMFVPLTQEEFDFQAKEMMTILDPRLSSILKFEEEPVGVVICIPDLNGFIKSTRSRLNLMTPLHFLNYRFNRKRAVIIFYSIAQSQQGCGLMGAMLDRTLKALHTAGYESLGVTWISEINHASLRQMELLGAKPLHGLHLFRRGL